MKPQEFIDLYMALAKRYPGRMEATNETAGDWYQLFKEVPASTLKDVLSRLGDFEEIDLRYVPNAYQIKAACKQAAGLMDWSAAMPDDTVPSLDELRKDMFDLEQKFYKHYQLNHLEWVSLAKKFRDADRIDASEHCMEKYDRLEEQLNTDGYTAGDTL